MTGSAAILSLSKYVILTNVRIWIPNKSISEWQKVLLYWACRSMSSWRMSGSQKNAVILTNVRIWISNKNISEWQEVQPSWACRSTSSWRMSGSGFRIKAFRNDRKCCYTEPVEVSQSWWRFRIKTFRNDRKCCYTEPVEVCYTDECQDLKRTLSSWRRFRILIPFSMWFMLHELKIFFFLAHFFLYLLSKFIILILDRGTCCFLRYYSKMLSCDSPGEALFKSNV